MATFLIVDDSAADRQLAAGLLETVSDSTVLHAENGKEALATLEKQRPDLVLTDMLMPRMTGLELLTTLKSDHPDIPVILMTAHGTEELAAKALKEGAASYVPKRRLADDLLDTVERVLMASAKDRAHSQLMHHLTGCQLEFVLANDLTLADMLVDHLQEALRCMPLGDETERMRVGIAFKAALENAYYHGNLEIGATIGQANRNAIEELEQRRRCEPPYRDRCIRVQARISREEAVVAIADDGPGFDWSKLPAPTEMDRAGRITGRGIILMRTFLDEVVFSPKGNEVTLTKRAIVREPDALPE